MLRFVPSIVGEQIRRFVFVPSIVEEQILRFVFVPSIVEEQRLCFVFVPSIVEEQKFWFVFRHPASILVRYCSIPIPDWAILIPVLDSLVFRHFKNFTKILHVTHLKCSVAHRVAHSSVGYRVAQLS